MRRWVRRILAVAVALELLYFLYDQTAGIAVDSVRVPAPALAAATRGARIVHISDLHFRGRWSAAGRLAPVVRRLDPAIVFITGDLVSGDSGIAQAERFIREIAPGRTVIVTLGNNDHSHRGAYVNTTRLRQRVAAAGALVLVNESLKLTVNGGPAFYVTGLDDNYLWRDDIFRASENVPRGAPRILLAHTPNIVEKIDTAGIALVLAGHTHGGQIVPPFTGPLYLNKSFMGRRNFAAGLYAAEGTQLFVSRGVGAVALPLRMFCRPEVTVVTFY